GPGGSATGAARRGRSGPRRSCADPPGGRPGPRVPPGCRPRCGPAAGRCCRAGPGGRSAAAAVCPRTPRGRSEPAGRRPFLTTLVPGSSPDRSWAGRSAGTSCAVYALQDRVIAQNARQGACEGRPMSPVSPARPQNAEERAAQILARVAAPTFADRVLDITDFGAVGDGTTDCTASITAAIEACSSAGGGRVLVPAGRYHTGAVHLLDDVDLHLAEGAVLAFSQDPDDYLPPVRTRYEGMDCYNYSPLLYANGRRNVALTGRGVVDGGADEEHWWSWVKAPAPHEGPAKQRLLAAAAAGVPVQERVFGAGHHLRPNLLQLVDCHNVLISGLTFRRSPMWTVHPLRCTNVTVRGITVDSH